MSGIKWSIAAVALIAVAASRAQGATLVTPVVLITNTDTPICIASNIGTGEATVTIELISPGGTVVAPPFAACPTGILSPGASCIQSYSAGSDGRCVFTVKGKVRALLEVVGSGGTIQTVIAATK
ncbi:MAG TPA: hypothetical protein VJ826_02740 [Candidatus Polarisedimenticolaceae bacterium]|nr:hypothetical protein [Candidatus Polarisedimenticolaceae bacterium]